MRWFKLALTIGFALAVGLFMALYQEQSQPKVVWGKQWGTVEGEWVYSFALDGQGNMYISGTTEGNLFGQNQGGEDIFVIKLDNNGQILWGKQLGTPDDDVAELCVDIAGNIYIGATTQGSWFSKNLGIRDIVLLKLSNDGQLIWGKQFGTNEDEQISGIVVDQQSYVYIIGWTRGKLFGQYQREDGDYEGFLVKFDTDGNLVWRKQFKDDWPECIVIDSQGRIYVGGTTHDDINNTMVNFLAKYESNGTLVWRQVVPEISERENENFGLLALDGSGNVYIAGQIEVFIGEHLLVSRPDAFLAKHDGTNGQRLWSKRLKSQDEGELEEELRIESFHDVTVDRQGNIYVVGFANGSLFGNHLGEGDVVLAKFDSQGNKIWSKQWGTEKGDTGSAIEVDRNGNIYVAGETYGNLFGTNAGKADIFLVKFRQ